MASVRSLWAVIWRRRLRQNGESLAKLIPKTTTPAGTSTPGACFAHWATYVCQVSSLSNVIWRRRLRQNLDLRRRFIPKRTSSGVTATLETCSAH
ncbi:hypothetical protein DPMN_040955 [Dreissena polymorpha]|uniref:Uncharacterized protein n=1 Tax=Dreissena polymorpha TaxID=45954 RepID=A0A9D4HXF4_DREPO|nr:hypothetical protein DPMN_040955 [Dreissena polymorpha]